MEIIWIEVAKHASKIPTAIDLTTRYPMVQKRFLTALALYFSLGHTALGQVPESSRNFDVPLAPFHAVPLTQSLPRLVTEGWQIVGVSLRERTFAYHLVRQGNLVLCLSDLGQIPPGTECMQLVDGVASSRTGGAGSTLSPRPPQQ
ncbi:Hypothetical protein RMP42_03959 (plasmid) [Roseomonas mucosa]|nr:Hypothetical protein RMP42_03959 [Roseomonas mucosa]